MHFCAFYLLSESNEICPLEAVIVFLIEDEHYVFAVVSLVRKSSTLIDDSGCTLRTCLGMYGLNTDEVRTYPCAVWTCSEALELFLVFMDLSLYLEDLSQCLENFS